MCLSLICLFFCEKYYIADDMYNHLDDLMASMKSKIALMKHSIDNSCNSGKYHIGLVLSGTAGPN